MKTAIVTDSNSGIFETEGQKQVSSSQPSPGEMKDTWELLLQSGYDELVYIPMSSGLSGRVTPAGAAMGTLLHIRPLLIIQGERLDAFAKVRGTQNCKKRLIQEMQKTADEFRTDGSKLWVGGAGSFADQEEENEWKEMVREAFPEDDFQYDPLTFSIGCHVGEGAFGMGISKKIQAMAEDRK